MARYFFTVHNEGPTPDTEGEDLPNDEAAWRKATLIAGELFKDIDSK
jgi:hypothetical protein